MLFYDDFTGSELNTSRWQVYDRISDEVNGELNCVLPANISVSGSIFTGVAKFEDHTCGDTDTGPTLMHYTSFQCSTYQEFIYPAGGKLVFRARAKMPGGIGCWPLIWLLSQAWHPSQPFNANTTDYPGTPSNTWAEIDWVEYLFNTRTKLNCVIHAALNEGSDERTLSFDTSTRFVIYQLEWSSGQLIWSIDYEDGTGLHVLKTLNDAGVPSNPMYLILEVAVGGGGVGAPDSATFPQSYFVDWVSVDRVPTNETPPAGKRGPAVGPSGRSSSRLCSPPRVGRGAWMRSRETGLYLPQRAGRLYAGGPPRPAGGGGVGAPNLAQVI